MREIDRIEEPSTSIEIWSFCYAKAKNAPADKKASGDAGHALALYFVFYNWMRAHSALEGKTPAMAAKLTTKQMTMLDLVLLMDRSELESRLGLKSN